MKGLEAAIRNALARAGETDAQARARIYQSARAALESGLKKQGIDDPAVIARQRQRLESIIEEIEREERLTQTARNIEKERRTEPTLDIPAEPADAEFPSVDSDMTVDSPDERHAEAHYIGGVSDETPVRSHAAADEISVDGPETTREEATASADTPLVQDRQPRGKLRRKNKERKQPRRRWVARLFSLIVVIGFGVTAYWWAESSGILLSPEQRDTSVPNPPPSASEEDFEGGLQSFQPERGFDGEWTAVYEAGKSGSVKTGADASAELRDSGDGQYLAVSAPSGGAGSSISIAITRNVLSEMAGQRSIIALTVRGVSQSAQMSVTCDLGAAASDCGSHRFALTDERADLFFDVQTPSEAGSSGDGSIIINPAAGGADGEIELYSVHIEPASAPADGT